MSRTCLCLNISFACLCLRVHQESFPYSQITSLAGNGQCMQMCEAALLLCLRAIMLEDPDGLSGMQEEMAQAREGKWPRRILVRASSRVEDAETTETAGPAETAETQDSDVRNPRPLFEDVATP